MIQVKVTGCLTIKTEHALGKGVELARVWYTNTMFKRILQFLSCFHDYFKLPVNTAHFDLALVFKTAPFGGLLVLDLNFLLESDIISHQVDGRGGLDSTLDLIDIHSRNRTPKLWASTLFGSMNSKIGISVHMEARCLIEIVLGVSAAFFFSYVDSYCFELERCFWLLRTLIVQDLRHIIE